MTVPVYCITPRANANPFFMVEYLSMKLFAMDFLWMEMLNS